LVSTLAIQVFLLLLATPASAQPPQQSGPTTRSPHGALNIPCQNCHTFSGWKPIRSVPEFDHNRTKYPLRGMHKNVACQQCHVKGVFSDVGSNCADCHADIHRRQMGAQCDRCHSVNGWAVSLKSVREHQNRFPLLGAHAVVECDSCHKGAAVGRYQGLSTECSSCHMNSFVNTKSPNHVMLGFPTQCQQCHTMDTWAGAKFDHSFTGFVLAGAHARLECSACHLAGRFQGTSANCMSCHAKDFNRAKDPDHVRLGFPQTCSQCHNSTSWAGARFDHNSFTAFPLTGAHATVACSQCHVNGRYAGTPKTCNSCHLTDYQRTTNPNHTAVGFPTDCSICHSTTNWQGARFDHATTGFPLTGAHATQPCSNCHTSGTTALNAACVTCHLRNYNSTTNPNHVTAGFPQQCNVCHSTAAWQPASFNHNSTAFPLTGAHTAVACANCHIAGRYAGTPTDCYSCHRTVYQSVTNPNHIAAGFPTTCQTCHTTTRWTGATFNHTWFPIPHNTARLCSDCHTNPSNYAVFLCTNCHTQTATANEHSGVSGYVWNSTNCYSCHRSGN
jgi:hypothetical protein